MDYSTLPREVRQNIIGFLGDDWKSFYKYAQSSKKNWIAAQSLPSKTWSINVELWGRRIQIREARRSFRIGHSATVYLLLNNSHVDELSLHDAWESWPKMTAKSLMIVVPKTLEPLHLLLDKFRPVGNYEKLELGWQTVTPEAIESLNNTACQVSFYLGRAEQNVMSYVALQHPWISVCVDHQLFLEVEAEARQILDHQLAEWMAGRRKIRQISYDVGGLISEGMMHRLVRNGAHVRMLNQLLWIDITRENNAHLTIISSPPENTTCRPLTQVIGREPLPQPHPGARVFIQAPHLN
ncbi:unnamed protein product, partial [Mesorhabditis spiculigera]